MTGQPGGSESGARPGSAPPAQPAGFSSVTAAPGVTIDGPPAPVAPEIITRDAAGRATVRAVRLNAPLRVDGVLDDGIYETVPSIESFVQQLPIEGAPTTERTEAWVFFSDEAVYVAARLWASAPESDWIANEMQRDSFQIIQNDYFSVGLDTFYDRRNGVAFMITPIGGFFDYEITDEGNPNSDWNPIWNSQHGPVRRGLDRRDGDPVQVAPLPAGRRSGLGAAARTEHPLQERDHLPDDRPHLGRSRHVPAVGGGHPDRGRGAERQPPVRDQALRHRLGQQRTCNADPADDSTRARATAASTSSTASRRT